MIAASLVLALFLDCVLGDPRWLPHPVVAIGRLVAILETILRRIFPNDARGELAAGGILVLMVAGATWGFVVALMRLADAVYPGLGVAVQIWLAFQAIAAQGLRNASLSVRARLIRRDLPGARMAVGEIVGRETKILDKAGVLRATVETVAENASDGVIAPMLYFALGGAPLAWLYKAINTMDSMVGYRNERYLYFGRIAARVDDAVNFLPARVTAALLVVAAAALRYDWRNAVRVWRRDRFSHASPNSAQPEAVCAGALHVHLGGNAVYGGIVVEKPTIGDPGREIATRDIRRVNSLLGAATFFGLLLFVAARWTIDGGWAWR